MRKEYAVIIIAMIIVSFSIAGIFFLVMNKTPISIKYAENADLGEVDSGGGIIVLSQTFETSNLSKYGKIEQIGVIDNTKISNDNLKFGFRITWNVSILENFNFVCIMTYDMKDTSEGKYDFKPIFEVEMKHNGSLSYKFSAIVSQLDNCPPEGWPFEVFGKFQDYAKTTLSFNMLDDARYFFIRDDHIDITLSFDDVKIEKGFITEILFDYAPLEVYDSLKTFG